MNTIVKNKYLDVLLKLMLFSAVVHMIVLFVYIIKTLDFYSFNFFTIIGLDLFYGDVFSNIIPFSLSLVTMIAIYYLFLHCRKNK